MTWAASGWRCVLWGLALSLGVALAQTTDPADPFGALPEPPTEKAPEVVHDPAPQSGPRLQNAQEAFSALPLDRRGKPDWVRALRERAIQPRAELRGNGAMEVLPLDTVMRNTAEMPHVRFPHQAHTEWLSCSNCHDSLFVPKAGANPTNMAAILRGQSCGVCHTTVAFNAMFSCERCHNVLQPGQKAWW